MKIQHFSASRAVVRVTGSAPLHAEPAAPEKRVADFGINLAPVTDYGTEFPFVDLMKMSRRWVPQRAGVWDTGEKLPLDENGYVTSLEPDQWAVTLMANEAGQIVPEGIYTFFYEGEGEVEWDGLARFVEEGDGRDLIEITQGDARYVKMTIKGVNPDNPLRNMRLISPGHEETYEDKPFRPGFLETWRRAGTFRFMDWMRTNVATENKTWNDRAKVENVRYTTGAGVPLETMIQLCNETQANGWFCVPHLADDEYIRNMATLIRDRLDPGLVAIFEFSNEVWNNQFSQSKWAEQQGMELELATRPWEAGWAFYARDVARMADIVGEVFAGAPERRQRVVATQAVNPHVIKKILEGADLSERVELLAIAPYVTFNVGAEARDDRPGAAEVAGWSMDRLMGYVREECLPKSLAAIDAQAEVAEKHGFQLVAYEGGQHLDALGEAKNNEALVNLLNGANRDPRMGEIYTAYLDHWTAAGGRLHCLFTSVQRYTRYGAWGLLENYLEDPAAAPKFTAVRKWAEARAKPAE
jgi:hypothetical protein